MVVLFCNHCHAVCRQWRREGDRGMCPGPYQSGGALRPLWPWQQGEGRTIPLFPGAQNPRAALRVRKVFDRVNHLKLLQSLLIRQKDLLVNLKHYYCHLVE
jgi:hypothetical protein